MNPRPRACTNAMVQDTTAMAVTPTVPATGTAAGANGAASGAAMGATTGAMVPADIAARRQRPVIASGKLHL